MWLGQVRSFIYFDLILLGGKKNGLSWRKKKEFVSVCIFFKYLHSFHYGRFLCLLLGHKSNISSLLCYFNKANFVKKPPGQRRKCCRQLKKANLADGWGDPWASTEDAPRTNVLPKTQLWNHTSKEADFRDRRRRMLVHCCTEKQLKLAKVCVRT